MNEPTQIISTIRLTEKASLLGEKHNQYVFRVDPKANKLEIKQAIEQLLPVAGPKQAGRLRTETNELQR